ncbi:hypothetical protein Tco_1362750 [Tanacetum coccineum]
MSPLLGFKRLQGFLEVTTAQITVLFIILLDNLRNRSRIGINKWYQSFALRNFDLEDMEFESTNSGTTAKLPILKLGEYEMWVIRIKQYFQIQDYALWEVIENGDSWVSVPQTAQENGTSVTKMSIPVTAEEKSNKKNDVKARSLLLMALPNEHQLTFNHASSAESLNSIFNRLQNIVSRLAILGAIIAQEDLNSKVLSSLPPEWNTYVVVWMNKHEVETMSIDDLYNNFKIVKQKVKKSVGTSSGAQNLAFMIAPSTNSTNDANTASPQVSTASVSDNAVYAFMVENPNGSNVLHQDLEQIHEDDLEAIDLKWQLSLLSVRVKKYYQRTGKKIFINANDIAGSKEGQFRNQDNTRKQGNNEDKSTKAMLAIDGVGFDWSNIAKEQVQTNMALMAFLDSEVYTDKTCSKTSATYKRGLATVEEQLITYRKNEVLFSEEVAVLKREVACKDYEINMLKSEFEKVKQEKDGIEFKIEKFDKASKDLDQLLGSQITDKSKKGLGYSAVPPPHPLIYNRPKKLDLSYSGLDEFKEPKFKGYGPENSKQESNVVCDKKSDNSKENSKESLVEEQVSQDTSSFVESSPNVDKETVFPVNKKVEFTKPKNHEKPVKKSVRYAEMYRSQSPRGNQRNWNGQKSNQLGKDFVMYNKACFICGSFNHLQINCDNHQRKGIVSRNNYNRVDAKTTHPSVHRNMSPRAVLLKTGLTPLNTVRPVNTAHPKSAVHSAKSKSHFSKQAQSTAQRPFYKQTTLTRRSVHTAKRHYYTRRPRVVNTARSYTGQVSTVRVKGVNAVKTLACWVWRPTKPNGASLAFKRHNYIDARGRSKSVMAWVKHIEYLMLNASPLNMLKESKASRHVKRGQDKKIPESSGPLEKGSGPRCQDTILGDVDAQTSIQFLLLVYINAAKLMLILLGSVNAVRHMLMLLVQVPVPEGDFINISIQGFIYFFIRFQSFKHSLIINPNSISSLIIIMSSPKFAETHNVVAFLEKPVESNGFAEIIDFLKASSVHYALTVNPIIYTSYIKQFWATTKVQTVNGVRRLQALVDKKRVIVTESSIRCDLHLEDGGGTDCLPTTTIFEELARMGYEKPFQKLTFYKAFFSPQWKYFFHTITQCLSAKSTAWNKFSSTMASLIICLATNQKFNLSKYIFDAMVKHLDRGVKFLMYLCFLQVFINQQLRDMSQHKKIFVNPFHTKKVFANIKRAGKDFSGRITPLFDTMMVQSSEEVAKDAQAKEITDLRKRVQRLERKKKSRTTCLRRLKKVGMSRRVESSKDQESLGDHEDASKQGRSIEDIDADAEVTLVNETQERQDDDLMFDTGVLDDDEVFVDVTAVEKEEQSIKTREAVTTAGVEDSDASTIPTTEEQVSVFKPTVSVTQPSVKDKGKGIMQEPERPLTKKDQVAIDEDLARNIQAQLDAEIIEEERLKR